MNIAHLENFVLHTCRRRNRLAYLNLFLNNFHIYYRFASKFTGIIKLIVSTLWVMQIYDNAYIEDYS